ncbi:MAG: hypothetical protein H6732_16395 [Alphaproteobacteria bacterium]|nr:hypothetical protein [Alphaproteobacteria bacterium]
MRWWALALLAGCVVEGSPPDDSGTPDVDSDEAPPVPTDSPVVDTPGETAETGTPPPPPPPPLPSTSWLAGTRLQVETWEVDGVQAFARFHDRQLGVPCTVELADDGELRCLPVSAQARERFVDTACTERVFVVEPDACEQAPFLRVGAPDTVTCGVRERAAVYPLASLATPPSVYRQLVLCEFEGPVPEGSAVYALQPVLEPPLDPTGFVRFREELRFGAAGVGVRLLTGDDGAMLVTGLVDAGGGCAPLRLDGGPRCVPEERALRSVKLTYGAADCVGTPVGRDEREEECAPARVVATQEPLSAGWTVAEAAGSWAGDVYVGGASCVRVTNDGRWVTAGDPIDPVDLPGLQAVTEGSGDLQLRVWRDADGARLGSDPTWPFQDVAAGLGCRPIPTADGAWVCLPEDAVDLSIEASWFADAACSEVVFSLGNAPPDIAFVRGRRACAVDDDALDLVVGEAWRFGDLFTGLLHVKAGETCVPAFQTPPGTAWRRGERVAPTSVYPALALVRSP